VTIKAHFDSQVNEHFAVVNSLGRTVIIETVRSAAFYITHSDNTKKHGKNFNTELKEAQSCFMFIQGSGLQVLINRFGLAYNADHLRDTFNYCVRKSA